MSSSSLHFRFAVDSVPVSLDVDTRRNVRKPIHDVVYTSNLGSRSASSAYVGSRPITPSLNILFKDRSNSIGENNIRTTSSARFFSGPSTEVSNPDFLLTDSFVRSPDGSTLLPLFYKHLLTTDVIAIDSVKVFDAQGNEVSQTYWKVEVLPDNRSYLMNSLESSYDAATADYRVYWVQYGTISGVSTIGTRKVLVSNRPAFEIATFDDINPLTSSLYVYAKAYVLSLLLGGGYTVTLPDPSKTYAIRDSSGSKIELKLPISVDDEDFWFASVTNAQWTRTYRTNNDPEVFTYDVPEYYDQDFNPFAPFKLDEDRKAFWVEKRIVKLPREDIAEDYSLDLVVWDKDEEVVKYALTTDSTKVGEVFLDSSSAAHTSTLVEDNIYWTSDEILSIDYKGGFIHVSVDLRSDAVLRTTFYYEEKKLELDQLNLNPVLNPSLQGKKVIFYLVPKSEDPNDNLLRTNSIHYLVVNQYGTIDFASQDGSDGNLDIATILTGTVGYEWFYERTASAITTATIAPADNFIVTTSTAGWPDRGTIKVKNGPQELYVTYEGKSPTVFALTGTMASFGLGVTIGAPITVRLANFVDNYSVDTTWPFTPALGDAGTGNDGNWRRYLILGEICVVANQAVSDLSLIDTRLEGGDVSSSSYEAALALNPEVSWRRDQYEEFGQFFPGRGAIVVKLPYGLLTTYGGNLTEEQIREIVGRHISGGMYVLVRYV